MTQPDQLVPDGGLTATGIAALAAKTQQDWEDELSGGVNAKLDPLTELFQVITQTFLDTANTVINWFSDLTDLNTWLVALGDVVGFFYDLVDRTGFLGALQTIVDFFADITDLNTWGTTLQKIVDALSAITNLDTWLSTLKTLVTGLLGITNFESWVALFKKVIDFFAGILNLDQWLVTFKTLVDGLLGITNFSTFVDVLKTVINSLAGVTGLSTFLDVLKTVINSLVGVTGLSTFLDIFKTLITGLTGIANFESWVALFKTVIDFFSGIPGLSGFLAVFKTLVTGLLGITNFDTWVATFKQVTDFFNGIAANVRAAFLTSIKTVVDFFSGLITAHGSLDQWLAKIPGISDVLGIIQTITGLTITTLQQGLTELTRWTQMVPALGPLVGAITGDPTKNTLPDLIAFAKKILTDETAIPTINLFGFLPPDLLSMIPVGHVGNATPNLVTDDGFSADVVIQSGNGWSWDGTTNFSGATGGSAKVVGDGSVRQLLSNMIQVATGQKLDLSATVKWAKPSAATPTVLVGLRGYDAAGAVTFTKTVSSVVGKVNYTTPGTVGYTAGTNTTATASSGWVSISGTSEAIPAGTTQVRMLLGMTNGPAGTTAWFDNAVAQKSQPLPQNLVSGLVSDLLAKLPGTDYQALLTTIANTPGATLTTVAQTIAGFLTGNSTLNGSKIGAGNVGAAFIKDLADTWSKIVFGVSNGNTSLTAELQTKYSQFQQGLISAQQFTDYLTGVLAKPGESLQNFVIQMTGQATDIGKLKESRDLAIARMDAFNLALNTPTTGVYAKLADYDKQVYTAGTGILARLSALEKTPTTPPSGTGSTTPPPTAPTFVSVTDDFERTSLGSNWTKVEVNTGDGSTIGIPNGHDVKFTVGGLTNGCAQVALTWNGTGKAALTGYQRISTTLATGSGEPAIGVPAFNDLIAKASPTNPLYGIVCRYYATGIVKIFYRLGAWEADFFNPANTVGTFTAPAKPTTGTMFEFYAGDKSVSDQTKCFAKFGGNTVGPAYISSTVLNQLASVGATGWGFGMGNGLSGLVPQASASLNYWSAQDQV